MKILNILWSPVGIEPTTCRVNRHPLVPLRTFRYRQSFLSRLFSTIILYNIIFKCLFTIIHTYYLLYLITKNRYCYTKSFLNVLLIHLQNSFKMMKTRKQFLRVFIFSFYFILASAVSHTQYREPGNLVFRQYVSIKTIPFPYLYQKIITQMKHINHIFQSYLISSFTWSDSFIL